MENERKDIELRSEEVQEVMGQIPAWIVRWGITLLFLVVVALLVGSCFFKYPDVITADMTLTGQHPATAVVTRAAGKIQELLVRDNRPVKEGDWLAVIENHASMEDAIYLEKALERSGMDVDSLDKALLRYKELSPGDMQAAYSGLLSALHACVNYREIDYYPQKMASIRKQIALYKAYYNETERQRKTLSEQFALTRRQYARDSLLYSRSVISSYEHETARASLLQSRYSLEGASASAENLRIQIGEQEQSLLDLTLERSEKEFTLRQELQTAREQLLNSMNEWRLRYCLIAPVGGCRDFHQVPE
ncbi:biotin/lipoyl-binding protein [Parabacteroides distasonis]|nr:biotin/lipoyl-binding protein [Parabacteroides distasonis]